MAHTAGPFDQLLGSLQERSEYQYGFYDIFGNEPTSEFKPLISIDDCLTGCSKKFTQDDNNLKPLESKQEVPLIDSLECKNEVTPTRPIKVKKEVSTPLEKDVPVSTPLKSKKRSKKEKLFK